MSYIIMGEDECGSDFRAADEEFASAEDALQLVEEAEEQYPDAARLWVEELHDMSFYFIQDNYYEQA